MVSTVISHCFIKGNPPRYVPDWECQVLLTPFLLFGIAAGLHMMFGREPQAPVLGEDPEWIIWFLRRRVKGFAVFAFAMWMLYLNFAP
jgi:hypothetical protein